jgi:hypothetical protein
MDYGKKMADKFKKWPQSRKNGRQRLKSGRETAGQKVDCFEAFEPNV